MNGTSEPPSQQTLKAILETLKNLFVLEAARAGVPQHEIRKMVGISLNRVNHIAKHVKVTNIATRS